MMGDFNVRIHTGISSGHQSILLAWKSDASLASDASPQDIIYTCRVHMTSFVRYVPVSGVEG